MTRNLPSPLLTVVGPTASGKSAIAEYLAHQLDGELVSADALQVYRGMDIGTAKPTADQQRRTRYHGLDLFGPGERCSAGAYARAAWEAIDDIRSRGRLPILVGGSGFYVSAVVEGLDPLPTSDGRWRSVLEAVNRRRGTAHMHTALQRLDPEWATDVGVGDRQRILRALEVVLRTGRPMRAADVAEASRRRARHVGWLGIAWDRDALARRIAARVERMLAAGWIDEVARLLDAGMGREDHALQAIGYRELAAVLAEEMSPAEARERIERATRRLAKRQRTWLRRWPDITWLRLDEGDDPRAAAIGERAMALATTVLEQAAAADGLPRREPEDTMGPP